MERYNFEKIMFCFWNSVAAYKYKSNTGKIKLQAEKAGKNKILGKPLYFNNQQEFELWLDKVVDDETAIYNHARATSLLLNHLIPTEI
jgi:hypothetical protein